MTNNDIQLLIDKYLAGETSPAEERQLSLSLSQLQELPEDWQTILLMLGELTLGEAEYDRLVSPSHPFTFMIALRTILTAAAIYLVGLFVWLQQEPTAKPDMAYNNKVEKPQPAPQPAYCTEGTPREILLCYLERKQAMPNTYSQLKRMSDENK